VGLDEVFILFCPTGVAFAAGSAVGAFFDRPFPDGIGDHVGRLFIGGGEIDFVPKVQQEDLGFFPAAHRRNVRGGGLGGIDGGGSGFQYLVDDVVVGNDVFADKDGLLGFVQDQNNQIFGILLVSRQVVTPKGIEIP